MHLCLRSDMHYTSMCNLRNTKSSIIMGCSNICHDKLIIIFDSELLEVKNDKIYIVNWRNIYKQKNTL